MDQLKKAKDGYTDQFQLDFNQLYKVFLKEQYKKANGQRTVVPESKPQPPKRNIAKEKRDRMVNYGRKVTGFIPPLLKKKEPAVVVNIDYDDIKNQTNKERSDVGKIAAY